MNVGNAVIELKTVDLIPVVELEPYKFGGQGSSPPVSRDSQQQHQYWLASLANVGITGLTPLWPSSWHVATTQFTDPVVLQRFLSTTIADWGGIEVLDDPDCQSFLSGGLALSTSDELLLWPQCCSDLGNIENWRNAAISTEPEWQMLWIGHPYVFVKHETHRVILSDLQYSELVPRWALDSGQLQDAVRRAEVELQRFADRICPLLASLGYRGNSSQMARKLVGLSE